MIASAFAKWNPVALHEIGHAIGLAHSSDPCSVVSPVVGDGNRDLNAGDIAGIQALYEPTPTAVAAMTPSTNPAGTIIFTSLKIQHLSDMTRSLFASPSPPFSRASLSLLNTRTLMRTCYSKCGIHARRSFLSAEDPAFWPVEICCTERQRVGREPVVHPSRAWQMG